MIQIRAVKPLISVKQSILRVKSRTLFSITVCIQYSVPSRRNTDWRKLMYSEMERPNHSDEDLPALGDQRHGE